MFPTSHTSRSRRSGVTLVEIVIAIFVLTVGVLSIFALFPTGYQLTRSSFDSSVSALAARDAKVRIRAERLRFSTLEFPDRTAGIGNGLEDVPEAERIGTVEAVTSSSRIEVLPSTEEDTDKWGSLGTNCYIVFTSGALRGRLFRITGAGQAAPRNYITCSSGTFRMYNSNVGAPVSVGDHFAIIGGSGTGFRMFPRDDTDTKIGGTTIDHSSFIGTVADRTQPRTVPIAHQGRAADARDWLYSYGAIISESSPEMPGIYRVDIFVYRGFSDSDTLDKQDKPVGHFTTYVSGLDSVDSVD